MKDLMDTLTADLLAQPNVPLEHRGHRIDLYVDHDKATFMMVMKATNEMYIFYDDAAEDFWGMYILGLHANKYDPDKTLEQLWNEYTYHDVKERQS